MRAGVGGGGGTTTVKSGAVCGAICNRSRLPLAAAAASCASAKATKSSSAMMHTAVDMMRGASFCSDKVGALGSSTGCSSV